MPESTSIQEVIAAGEKQRLLELLKQGVDPNTPGRLGATPLMAAIEARSTETMQLLLDHGADPELTDNFNSTALATAVSHDFAEGVRLLLARGVDRGWNPKYPLKEVDYGFLDSQYEVPPMPEEMAGVMSPEDWEEMSRAGLESLRELGQNPEATPLIADVGTLEVLQLFLEAGEPLDLAPEEVKRELLNLGSGGGFTASKRDFRSHRKRRFGRKNPESMDNPFWGDMIRLGVNAYEAREHFGSRDVFDNKGPVWCFDRFGDTITPLPDGRFVQIGGEHEDYYDTDFCIYNDLVVHDGRGGFKIFGYPEKVFPPTDFHTATLLEDAILVIGCLGYVDQRREGVTPVYRVELESWKISPVETSGDAPGWLSRHRADSDKARRIIRVRGGVRHRVDEQGDPDLAPNASDYELCLKTMNWTALDGR